MNRCWRTKLRSYPDQRERNRVQFKTRSRVEHVFAVLKLRFGFTKVRYRGLAKNTQRLLATCALVNLLVARKHLGRSRVPACPCKTGLRCSNRLPPSKPRTEDPGTALPKTTSSSDNQSRSPCSDLP